LGGEFSWVFLGIVNNNVIKIHTAALALELGGECRALVSCCANDTFHSQFDIVFMVRLPSKVTATFLATNVLLYLLREGYIYIVYSSYKMASFPSFLDAIQFIDCCVTQFLQDFSPAPTVHIPAIP
jgi:hypothetical protein